MISCFVLSSLFISFITFHVLRGSVVLCRVMSDMTCQTSSAVAVVYRMLVPVLVSVVPGVPVHVGVEGDVGLCCCGEGTCGA